MSLNKILSIVLFFYFALWGTAWADDHTAAAIPTLARNAEPGGSTLLAALPAQEPSEEMRFTPEPGNNGAALAPPWMDPQKVRHLVMSIIEKTSEDAHLPFSCDIRSLRDLYAYRHHRLMWMDGRGLNQNARDLLDAIKTARLQGLTPEDYHLARITGLVRHLYSNGGLSAISTAEKAAELELLLTDAFFLYGLHLSRGHVDPAGYDFDWHIEKPQKKLAGRFFRDHQQDLISAYINCMEPAHPGYRQLKQALKKYIKIEESGGWQPIPDGAKLVPGDYGIRVTLLKKTPAGIR